MLGRAVTMLYLRALARREAIMHKTVSGFTLIELMIVVAVMAIILAIAIPSYNDYIRRARRTEAIGRMQDIAVFQEKFRSENPGYTNDWNRLGGNPDDAGATAGVNYNWTVTVVAANPGANTPASYQVTATAQGGQASDKAQGTSCTPLSMTSAGVKGPDAKCWR
ncbi:MAG TPA: type IV pilin protein [Candidatus Saccharimonadia bacterium]|nr:type IV pilin protein [Candidatus Saccharimonadia bacterium]